MNKNWYPLGHGPTPGPPNIPKIYPYLKAKILLFSGGPGALGPGIFWNQRPSSTRARASAMSERSLGPMGCQGPSGSMWGPTGLHGSQGVSKALALPKTEMLQIFSVLKYIFGIFGGRWGAQGAPIFKELVQTNYISPKKFLNIFCLRTY